MFAREEVDAGMGLMPSLFIGHGSPMNAIEKNEFSDAWIALGERLPKPEAILSVSAHWFTEGTRVSNAEKPRMIYDMYGFPDALYRVNYPALGAPRQAELALELLHGAAQIDNGWGLDHGTWSVLRRLYPQADIPVFQVSVNRRASMQTHFALGRTLRALRSQGVLILGSGNVVHNLAAVDFSIHGGFPWAETFDRTIRTAVENRDFESVIAYERAGAAAAAAVPTADHFAPLLYVLGAAEDGDQLTVLNDSCVFGSLSMTSYLFTERGNV